MNVSDHQATTPSALLREHREKLVKLEQKQRAGFKFFGCDHLYHQIAINSDGSVHPCAYALEPRHLVGRISKGSGADYFNNEILQTNRAIYDDIGWREIQAYDPCRNCWIMGRNEANGYLVPNHRPETNGHIRTAINFLSAFEIITGQSLSSFLPKPRTLVSASALTEKFTDKVEGWFRGFCDQA